MKLSAKSPKTKDDSIFSKEISKPYIINGLIILVLILSGVLLYVQYSALQQLQAEIKIEEAALDTAQTNIALLLEHKANEANYLNRMSEIDAIVPSELNEPMVMHYLNELLDEYDVDNKNIRSGSIYRTNGLTSLQIFISGDSNYHTVSNLAKVLTNGSTVFRIIGIDIEKISGGNNSLNFEIEALTFTTEELPTRDSPPEWATAPGNEFVSLGTWSGDGMQSTGTFTTQTGSLKLMYDTTDVTDPAGIHFSVTIYDANDNRPKDIMLSIREPAEGESYYNIRPGEYYLKINAANVRWALTLEGQ